MPDPQHAAPPPSPTPRPATVWELFTTFNLLALQGFGGVMAFAQQVLCERKRWLTQAEFTELLSVGQVLPGPNVVNMSLMLGDRYFGVRGALAALAGMLTVPLVIVLALTALYSHFADLPAVAGALRGMAAVSAGMICGTALKLAGALRRSPLGAPASLMLGAAAFGMVALLRWPLVWVLLGLGTLACLYAWRTLAAAARAAGGGAA